MEASALPASVGLTRTRLAIGAPLLRLRSDEQLVSLFRAGSDEAFRAIHDRYRARMLAYTRQMLAGSPQDPEDAVQEIFVRAYAGLRANRRELALRAWLYRIAHNRCIDELRRPHAVALETIDSMIPAVHDPVTKAEQRDSLRRLIVDVQRLPDQQRSALLMREMGGMAYADVAGALGVSVPAVKSLLVRARLGLAQASEARDTACAQIREDLIASHDRGVRASGLARRHMRDCASCRQFRVEVRGVSRRFAALTPTLGPIGVLANLLGWGSGGGAAAGSGTAVAGTGAAASAGVLAGGTGHVVTLLAAAVVATGGAVEVQHTLATSSPHRTHVHRAAATHQSRPTPAPIRVPSLSPSRPSATKVSAAPAHAAPAAPAPVPAPVAPPAPRVHSSAPAASHHTGGHPSKQPKPPALTETLDPDNMMYGPNASNATTPATGTGKTGTTAGSGLDGSSTSTGSSSGSATGTATSGTTGSTTPGTTGSTTGGTGSTGSAATSTSATGSGSSGTTSSESSTGTGGTSTGVAPSGSGTTGSSTGATGGSTGTGSTYVGDSPSSASAGSLSSFAQTP